MTIDLPPRHGWQGDRGTEHLQPWRPSRLCVTISRETGSRGSAIARRVADLLGWQVYDQELLEYTAQNPFIRQELFTSLSDEGRDWTEELFGKLGVADKGESVQHLVRVILALGTQGGLVLVGRGAGFILPMETTLRVRIVAPLEDRIAYVRQAERLNREEAAEAVRSRDERRERFVREQLGQSIEAVHGYGLVLNSSELSEEGSAEIIAAALRWKVKQG